MNDLYLEHDDKNQPSSSKPDSHNESSQNKNKNQDDKHKKGPTPPIPPSQSTNPLPRLIFWLLLVLAIPIALFFSMKDEESAEEIPESKFRQLLANDQIKTVTIERNPQTGREIAKGTYIVPSTSENGQPQLSDYRSEIILTPEFNEKIKSRFESIPIKNETNDNSVTQLITTLLLILVPVGLLYFLFSRHLRAAGRGALQFGKSRAQLSNPTKESVTFEHVAGVEEAKEELHEIVEFLSEPEKFQNIGAKIPKGCLMVGPPGTGKTLLARAIAGEAGVPFYSISGSDFVEMFVGVGASRVRDMFEEAKRNAPCLIFIDEIDAVGRSRFSGIGGGHDEREQTLNALLSEMDGFESNTNIIVIAATNRPDVLDPALMRPGRFDRRVVVDLPDMEGRHAILKIHTSNLKVNEGTDLSVIAKGTPGFSGADLANLCNEAGLGAARQGKDSIDLSDMEEARDKVRFGKERTSRKLDEKDRRITAYHEAGHTLISLFCEHATPLHKITIIPRGTAYLGATMNLPEKDRYTQSQKEFEDELAVLMGGRLAEARAFSDVTSGASMDLRQATEIAQRMVCEFGMSPSLGLVAYGKREEHIYLGRDITRSKDYSETTAREIDEEIRRIIGSAQTRASNILDENWEKLKLLAETVLEEETMSAKEIRDLLELPAPDNGDNQEHHYGESEAEETSDSSVTFS